MTIINRILHEDNVAFGCFVIGSSAFAFFYGRDSIGMKYYVKFMQKYKGTEPVPVHTILKFRLESVLNDLKISKYSREYYDLFIVNKIDPITVGSNYVKQGMKIGVPDYYQQATANGIKNSFNSMYDTPFDWSSQEGEQLLQSLTLSEEAQKFALAKAVFMGENHYFTFRAAFPAFFTLGYFCFSSKIISLKKLHLRSNLFTLGTYTLCGILFSILYVFCKDALYLQYDKLTDEKALDVSHAYLLGGIEYYEKKVKRNKVLRNLIKKGHKYYDEDGDERFYSSMFVLPDSFKLELSKERLQKYEFDKEAMTPPPVNPNPYPIM